jgi:hypothetical protein
MITQITQTVTTVENGNGIGDDVAVSDRRRDILLSVPPQHRVTLDLLSKSVEVEIRPLDFNGQVDYNNPDREVVRTQFYSASADVIAAAVVQYVARKHDTLNSSHWSDNDRAESAEVLRRIAGAMGLEYGAARVLLPGEV